ncbi:MAG: TonB-dependent receptor [Gammaproteobacteria bacterium]
MTKPQSTQRSLSAAIALALGLTSPFSAAQGEEETAGTDRGLAIEAPTIEQPASGPVEEVITVGRSLNSTQQLINERIDDEVVVDVLSSEAMSRLGDSTVATALRRVPGLSLVQNKFVYIRGLGERYSASSLNGANIPSPDLSRNVIPLDIFPTAVVESLRVNKAYSADMSANFGGGSVDIRTKGIPDQFTVLFEAGSGLNSQNNGTALSYAGGSDDDFGVDDGSRGLSPQLLDQINRFQGNVNVQGILNTLRSEGQTNATVADAQLINRQLGLQLNRDIGLEEKDIHPDISLRGSVGNNVILNQDWEVGFLVGANYNTNWRETQSLARNLSFPEERTDTELESTRSVNLSGNLNLGVRYTDDHELATTTLYLRNTDDETAVRDFFNENREIPDGIGFRSYRFQFEERDMTTNQVVGTHRLGQATRDMLPGGLADMIEWIPTETELRWFWSDAEANTDIPNQVDISAQTVTDPVTGEVLSSTVGLDATAADYRFTDLNDDVLNHGWDLTIPFETSNATIDVSTGYSHNRKARTYRQSQFSIGALSVEDPNILGGPLSDVFSSANISDPRNNFVFDIQGTNNQSYIAATMTDAVYGKVDLTINDTWRIAAGARWEDYRQVALDWNPFGFSDTDPVLTTDPEALERGSFQEDRIYPAVAMTYMSDWMAETFQLRFGWSETTVRPDLREITDASYIDPITDDLVDGNPGVVPADVTNIDMRAEWFFSGGDSLTATLFYKDITDPIEFFESAASDTTVAREIVNAESAEVLGIEIEGLKELGFLGSAFSQFYVQGNVTLQDSELVAGEEADAPTNNVRKLSGASDYTANLTLGFDSDNARHSAAIGYNVFGERLYVAGRNGSPDGFEQPFHSVDLTYSWYPTDFITVKARVQNLLDEAVEIERGGILTFSEDVGQSLSLNFQWAL